MSKSLSPLRYPGGKTKIYERVKKLIIKNEFTNRTYVEPFGGGFGIGINLLSEEIVDSVIYNDIDTHLYNFWYSVFYYTQELIDLINNTPVTVEERNKQKKIYNSKSTILNDGFATLFLNRVNFSGVIKGGPIGGEEQKGNYKIDCRFNKNIIIKKITEIARYKEKVSLYNKDARIFISTDIVNLTKPKFLNIDPPYVVKGSELYTNYFIEKDHIELEKIISKYLSIDTPWIVTYDDCPFVRKLYKGYKMKKYVISYNARCATIGKEIVITNLPINKFIW